MGMMYAEGRDADGKDVPKDGAKAAEWLQKAALQGNHYAQLYLSVMYGAGRGVPKDEAKAREWLIKAALNGNNDANWLLGVGYHQDVATLKDEATASDWWDGLYGGRRPANEWDWHVKVVSQGMAGFELLFKGTYDKGYDPTKDEAKAVEWFEKAANQSAEAQSCLGVMYAHGTFGLSRNDSKAVEWFQKAAEQGNAVSQLSLGIIYAAGRGVPKDGVRAYAWFDLAATNGAIAASKERDEIEKTLTPEQKAEARKLSAELAQRIHTK